MFELAFVIGVLAVSVLCGFDLQEHPKTKRFVLFVLVLSGAWLLWGVEKGKKGQEASAAPTVSAPASRSGQ